MGRAAGLIGGLTLATSGLADSTEHANAMNLALMGSFLGPEGAGIGAGIGMILDLKGAYDDLNDTIGNLGAAASGTDQAALVEQIAAAKKQLDEINAKGSGGFSLGAFSGPLAGLSVFGDHMGEATGQTDRLEQSIQDAEAQLAGLRDGSIQTFNPVHALAAAIGTAADMSEKQAQSLDDAIDRMQKMRQEALRAVNAQLNYQAAIDDATKAIKDNGRNFDITTEKGRANRQALYALADGWNQQSDAAKNAKGSLSAARANFIQTAQSMGATADQAHSLAKRLFEIPSKKVIPVTTPGMDGAISTAKTLKQILDGLHNKDINVALHYQTIGNKPHAPTPGASADGGTVPRSGRGYADRYHYMLADGEEVISNRHGQADRHRSLLKAINAGRMADGGTAGGRG
jgi:hypothetical protein